MATYSARRARRGGAALLAVGAVATSLVALGGPSAGAGSRGPDQVVAKVGSVPETVRYTTRFSMGARIANQGKAAAGASTVSFHFSRDKVLGAGDELGATTTVKRQVPGKVTTVAASVRAPMEGGKYWVIVCADSGRKVRETNEKNNCSVSKTQVDVDAGLHADLAGNLTFTDTGSKAEDGYQENWQRTASANLKMTFEDEVLDGTFASVGSTYNRVGSRDITRITDDCTRITDYDEAGEGTLLYTGNASEDDVYGWFTKTDMSEIRIGLAMRADWSQVDTSAGRGEFPCESSTKTTDGTGLVMVSVELKQVQQTTHSIVYEIADWEGPYGTESDFESATGRLTLSVP